MSLFDDIAHAIGHTVDTLAQDVGAGVYELESLVAGLANDGVEVFSAAEHFGLSVVDFLRRMVTILRGDPHQVLLHYVTGPIKPVNEQVNTLSMHWTQMAALHQDTAQTINAHLSDLYQANGSFSYSGQAAEALWNTHQQYQQHFTTLVEHAQTQQTRHATLGSHTSDFLSQAPGKVYSLSAPMAALGVMSFEMTAVAPPPVLDDPAVQGVEQGIEETVQTGEEGPPGILWIIIAIIVVVLVLVLVIVVLYVLIRDAIEFFQNQQKSTTVQQPKHKPMVAPPGHPVNLTTQQIKTAQELYTEFGGSIPLDEIEQMIADHPQWTKEKLRQELLRKQLREGKGYVGQLVGKTLTLSPGLTKTLTVDDIEAMIKVGYTNTHFAVLLGLRPLSDATTPEGRPLTWHALADSVPFHGVSLQEIDAVLDNPSRTAPQTDGGTAYIKSTKQGISLVITSRNGQIVTALKNLKPAALKQLGRNYGFDPNP